ncbi:hypothetical protein KM043_012029 [Ampulex compressa]|nr:hypothetical protein KM043_012029 [Ampulex compressa]
MEKERETKEEEKREEDRTIERKMENERYSKKEKERGGAIERKMKNKKRDSKEEEKREGERVSDRTSATDAVHSGFTTESDSLLPPANGCHCVPSSSVHRLSERSDILLSEATFSTRPAPLLASKNRWNRGK